MEVGVGDERERAVGGVGERAGVGRVDGTGGDDGDGVAVDVEIVVEPPVGGADRQRHAVIDDVGVVDGDRGVVERGDVDRDGGDVRERVAVVEPVPEGVDAVEVGPGRVDERTVVEQRHAAVVGDADQFDGEHIVVRIAVVDQHAGRVDRQRRVLVGRVGVVDGQRRVVDRGDVDRDGGGVGAAAVGDPIGKVVDAVEIGVGRVGEAAVGGQRQRAVGHVVDQRHRERIVLRIGVVAERPVGGVDGERLVFGRRVVVVAGGGREVDPADGDVDGVRRVSAAGGGRHRPAVAGGCLGGVAGEEDFVDLGPVLPHPQVDRVRPGRIEGHGDAVVPGPTVDGVPPRPDVAGVVVQTVAAGGDRVAVESQVDRIVGPGCCPGSCPDVEGAGGVDRDGVIATRAAGVVADVASGVRGGGQIGTARCTRVGDGGPGVSVGVAGAGR